MAPLERLKSEYALPGGRRGVPARQLGGLLNVDAHADQRSLGGSGAGWGYVCGDGLEQELSKGRNRGASYCAKLLTY